MLRRCRAPRRHPVGRPPRPSAPALTGSRRRQIRPSWPPASGSAAPGVQGKPGSSGISKAFRLADCMARRIPSSDRSLVVALPIRCPSTARMFTVTLLWETFWWIALPANRVNPRSWLLRYTSVCWAVDSVSARSSRLRAASSPIIASPPPERCGSGLGRRRGRCGRSALAGPCRSWACPTCSSGWHCTLRRRSSRTPA